MEFFSKSYFFEEQIQYALLFVIFKQTLNIPFVRVLLLKRITFCLHKFSQSTKGFFSLFQCQFSSWSMSLSSSSTSMSSTFRFTIFEESSVRVAEAGRDFSQYRSNSYISSWNVSWFVTLVRIIFLCTVVLMKPPWRKLFLKVTLETSSHAFWRKWRLVTNLFSWQFHWHWEYWRFLPDPRDHTEIICFIFYPMYSFVTCQIDQ